DLAAHVLRDDDVLAAYVGEQLDHVLQIGLVDVEGDGWLRLLRLRECWCREQAERKSGCDGERAYRRHDGVSSSRPTVAVGEERAQRDTEMCLLLRRERDPVASTDGVVVGERALYLELDRGVCI